MDSEHRHELKENDLRESLENWRETWNKYGTPITLVILLAVLAFAGTRLYDYYTTTKHEDAWSDYAATGSPQGMAEVAEDHSLPAVKMLALLRGGDLYLEEAVFPPASERSGVSPAGDGETGDTGDDAGGDPEDDPEDDPEGDPPPEAGAGEVDPAAARNQRLDRAEAMYRRVVDEAEHDAFRANALLGLAQVAETREQWDAARGYYDRAEALADEADLPEVASLAAHRRGMLDKLQQPVTIVDAPAPDASDADAPLDATTPGAGQPILPDLLDTPEPAVPAEGSDGQTRSNDQDGDTPSP